MKMKTTVLAKHTYRAQRVWPEYND